MLTAQDDLIGHQLPTTFDQIDNSDPAWMERLWYTGHPIDRLDMLFDVGLGYHPNRNVMDAFAGVAVAGRQWNFRVSRQLRPDPLTTAAGPLSIVVIEGLRRHRLVLGPNESGIEFDLEFLASMTPHEEKAHLRRRDGRITENMARAQQLGRYSGWIRFNGDRHAVTPDTWWGQRDHSWGVRAEMRTDETSPPLTYYPPFLYAWTTAQFRTRGLHVFFKERAPGDPIYLSGEETFPPGSRASSRGLLTDVTHDLTWHDDPLGQSLADARLGLTFADGRRRTLSIRTLPVRYYLKGGLYGGLNGWFHGDPKGKLYMESDCWDLTDHEVRRSARTLADQVIEIRDGDEVGYGIVEYGVGKGYARYESVQCHPPI
ncbi:MAG TPA: hypothetical protein PKA20_11510 [Burkholderiaceae bacterium]|nr:hypothetical protein [Burkholderiaceae bacterium]